MIPKQIVQYSYACSEFEINLTGGGAEWYF